MTWLDAQIASNLEAVESPAYLPSPAEIQRRCEQIRARWTDKDRERRQVGGAGLEWTASEVVDASLTDHGCSEG